MHAPECVTVCMHACMHDTVSLSKIAILAKLSASGTSSAVVTSTAPAWARYIKRIVYVYYMYSTRII